MNRTLRSGLGHTRGVLDPRSQHHRPRSAVARRPDRDARLRGARRTRGAALLLFQAAERCRSRRGEDSHSRRKSTAFVFTFDQDEGGYCKLYGLRYQLDNGGIDYTQFLDHDLDITVTVRDSSGTVGKGTVRVHVSPTIIGGM